MGILNSFKKSAMSLFLMLTLPPLAIGETELWFGSYINENGQLSQARYNVETNQDSQLISGLQLAPYGKPTIDFNVVEHDLENGFLTLEWPSNSGKRINLFRYNSTYYAGNWIDGTNVQLMILKKFNGQDAEMQGNWFKVSQTEIDVLTYAMDMLVDDKSWDRNDSRICGTTDQVNLFCALYFASVAVDGEYRHLRPAIKAVRETIEQKYPKKYAHVLADFNGAQETSLQDIHNVLMAARKKLEQSIKSSEHE